MKKKAVFPDDKKMTPPKAAPVLRGKAEKDIDDLVHSPEEELASEQTEEDPDDKIHRAIRSKQGQTDQQNNMADPDDLVHDYRDEDDER